MDSQSGQPTHQQTAIQAFKEFTGSESDAVAGRVLAMCNWDLQRAINVYFMRGAQLEQEAVEMAHEVAVTHPPPVHRVSHYVRRQQEQSQGTTTSTNRATQGRGHGNEDANLLDNSVEVIGGGGNDSDIQMLDNSTAEQQNGRTGASGGGDQDDEVRAPIPAVQGVLLAQSFQQTYQNGEASARSANPFMQFHQVDENDQQNWAEGTSSSSTTATAQSIDFKQRQAAHRAATDKLQLQQKRNQQAQGNEGNNDDEGIGAQWNLPAENNARMPLQEMEIGGAGTTGGFGQAAPRKDLRILFRPPVDLMFYGDWDKAIQTARQKQLWLLVNVQHSGEFASAALNRDIWSEDMVKELVRGNFLFWQVYHDSADGQRVQGYYGLNAYPTIFIVDPRTGEEVKKLEGGDLIKFLDDVTTFLHRYPTFETRDQEFRDIATKGGAGGQIPMDTNSNANAESATGSSAAAQIGESTPTILARESMTSPLGAKKRKQPSGPWIPSLGEWGGEDGEKEGAIWWENGNGNGGGDEFNYDDDSSREANRQAKKMKWVVTISEDVDESMQPSCSSSMRPSNAPAASIWGTSSSSAAAIVQKIEPKEWEKWRVPENTSQRELPRAQLQFRLPNGTRERICLWAQTPLRALFSLIASYGLDPHDQMLVLDFPRREFTTTAAAHQMDRSLAELGFGRQEMINVEKCVVPKNNEGQ